MTVAGKEVGAAVGDGMGRGEEAADEPNNKFTTRQSQSWYYANSKLSNGLEVGGSHGDL